MCSYAHGGYLQAVPSNQSRSDATELFRRRDADVTGNLLRLLPSWVPPRSLSTAKRDDLNIAVVERMRDCFPSVGVGKHKGNFWNSVIGKSVPHQLWTAKRRF